MSQSTTRTARQRGQTLVLFALFLGVTVASVGLVLDGGGAYAQQRNQQRGADLAALAGAIAETNCWSGCSGGVTPRQAMITAATNSAQANGYLASEVTINIPPTSGTYAGKGGDCSTIASMPCWIQVVVSRPHPNGFASIVGQSSWGVTAQGVAVGGVANGVANGLAPIMFNKASVKSNSAGHDQPYCDPQGQKCVPNGAVPDGTNPLEFAWTSFCLAQSGCNFNSGNKAPGGGQYLVSNGGVQITISLGMFLGPNNGGQHTNICSDLLAAYPNGADLPVAIEVPDPTNPSKNALLVGFWIWHLDTAGSNCKGQYGEQLAGYFTTDLTSTLPLTITPGGGKATTGQFIARLVQ